MRVLPEIANLHKLPENVRSKLAQLDLELSEGDITEKGFEKKRRILLAPYVQAHQLASKNKSASATDASAKGQKRSQRRLTRNDSRYHSEVRQEAVQQALAAWSKRNNEALGVAEGVDQADGTDNVVMSSLRPPICRRTGSVSSRSQSRPRYLPGVSTKTVVDIPCASELHKSLTNALRLSRS